MEIFLEDASNFMKKISFWNNLILKTKLDLSIGFHVELFQEQYTDYPAVLK